jgi:hypothetical protein
MRCLMLFLVVLFNINCEKKKATQMDLACRDRAISGYGAGSFCPDPRQRLDVLVRTAVTGVDAIYVCRCRIERDAGL